MHWTVKGQPKATCYLNASPNSAIHSHHCVFAATQPHTQRCVQYDPFQLCTTHVPTTVMCTHLPPAQWSNPLLAWKENAWEEDEEDVPFPPLTSSSAAVSCKMTIQENVGLEPLHSQHSVYPPLDQQWSWRSALPTFFCVWEEVVEEWRL